MGYERKRGKLEELNSLLRGGSKNRFSLIIGKTEVLPSVKYVITLDTDTQLPRDSARQLVGTMAHPLNRAHYNEKNILYLVDILSYSHALQSACREQIVHVMQSFMEVNQGLIHIRALFLMSIRMCLAKDHLSVKEFTMLICSGGFSMGDFLKTEFSVTILSKGATHDPVY